MKFISVLREGHEADEYTVAHLGIAVLVEEEEQVVRSHVVLLVGPLGAPFAVLSYVELGTGYAALTAIGVEHHGEVALRQLRQFACPLQGVHALELYSQFLILHAAKIYK